MFSAIKSLFVRQELEPEFDSLSLLTEACQVIDTVLANFIEGAGSLPEETHNKLIDIHCKIMYNSGNEYD